MLEQVKQKAKEILEKKEADGVLGLRKGLWDVIHPHVFTTPAEIDSLVLEPKWLLGQDGPGDPAGKAPGLAPGRRRPGLRRAGHRGAREAQPDRP